MPGLVRDWGRIKGKPTQYLFNNHTKNSWSGKTANTCMANAMAFLLISIIIMA